MQLIDLHCHILPAVDDGAPDLETSIAMAKLAYEAGTRFIACTPHIIPGKYENDASNIGILVRQLQHELDHRAIGITLAIGADIHIAPDIIDGLKTGRLPTLAASRYFLLEPSHHVLPPNLVSFCNQIMSSGFVPILTHPERLTWISGHYDIICALDDAGCLMQLTAGSIIGRFGNTAREWSIRMLEEDRVDLVASDGHDTRNRPPVVSSANSQIKELVGSVAAKRICVDVPKSILLNQTVKKVSKRAAVKKPRSKSKLGWL